MLWVDRTHKVQGHSWRAEPQSEPMRSPADVEESGDLPFAAMRCGDRCDEGA